MGALSIRKRSVSFEVYAEQMMNPELKKKIYESDCEEKAL